MRCAIALLILLWGSMAAAEVKVYPPDGQAVGIVTSDTPGRWMVFRAAPFGVVSSQPCTVAGVNGCMWFAEGGLFTAVLVPNDQALPFEFGTVNLGGNDDDGDDDDGPDPLPPPPPGQRLIMVVEEKDHRTVNQAFIYQRLKEYSGAKSHTWRLLDDDTVDEAGRPIERLQRYLEWLQQDGVQLPALIVAVKVNGEEKAWATTVPDTYDAAVKFVQEHGG